MIMNDKEKINGERAIKECVCDRAASQEAEVKSACKSRMSNEARLEKEMPEKEVSHMQGSADSLDGAVDGSIEESMQFESESAEGAQEKNENNDEEAALVACQAQVQQWQEKYLHVAADLQNFKSRVEKERAVWMKSAQAELLKKLLKIVDDFDRAVSVSADIDESNKQAHDMKQGLEMMHKSFHKFLDSAGVKELEETSVFDPEKHEALIQVASDVHESGAIIDIVEKGYMFGDVILRPAKVSVAQ